MSFKAEDSPAKSDLPLHGLAENPDLPPMEESGDFCAPAAPAKLDKIDVGVDTLRDLAVKLASTTPQLTTEWAADQMCLPMHIVEDLFWRLKKDQLVEVLGQVGPFNYRYASSQRGRDHAARLIEISGYIGPAPVSLAAYRAMIEWQQARRPAVSLETVRRVLAPLVLPDGSVTVAALAAASGRSLFLFGPSGNGKTSVGTMLHNALEGDLWIPHCIAAGSSFIRMFDAQVHRPSESGPAAPAAKWDRRWLRIKRPLIISGGEMTLEEMDLIYSPSLRYYESPPHVKANGGLFLIDDFGRQKVEPHALLNRWIVPLERRVDFLTLHTGQKIQMPFEVMLVVSTNLKVSDVADPAFLRRMGYRLHLQRPDAAAYAEIFLRYANGVGMRVPSGLMEKILSRYRIEGRDLRASEPRDLIERARDICSLHQRAFELTEDVVELAWEGYFGNPREPEGTPTGVG
jgi:hypothetical protein